ncbi:MAG TPA: NADPH:quinone oxidoreductase family protein [Acidimicrobiales bacterium]|nr:NADPH:quinone oxidoreductase family protein [Acidimicrobiales bacterium]
MSESVRVVVCNELGSLDDVVVEERDTPVPGRGQVVVDVRAAGVNYVDGLICQGRYQMKPTVPYVPGGEIAGVVSAVGEGVTGVKVGDRVMAMTGFGAFAEQVAVNASSVDPVPDALAFTHAAAFIQSYCTAWFALARRITVSEGEWVLVLGAGGGIGLAAVDVAVALGAQVVAAASSAEKLDAARGMGALATVEYEREDLKARVRALTGGGVDVVVDPVGGRHSEPALRATRTFGRFCVIGFASGPIASIPLNQVLLNNRTLVGVDWGAWAMRDPEGHRSMLGELIEMVQSGRLHPVEPSQRPLDEAAAVMASLLDRTVTGKVVLVP